MSTISKLTISVELNALLQKIKQRIQEVKPSDVTEAAAQEILERLPIVRHLFDDLSEKNQTQLSKELLALTQEQIDQLLSVVELTRNELRWIQRQVSARSILPTIEYILKKRDKLSPQLFRPEPVWSDYESGYVVEREEVDTIISRLKQQGAQLVIGKPASGKSIILKYVGYKLSQQGKTVYFIDVKTYFKELLSDYIFN